MQIHAQIAPIRFNTDGVALVGNTRVPLQTVISAFHRGDSPEQIVDSFDALTLAEVYAVIAYYLAHRQEVDTYLNQQKIEAEQTLRDLESRKPEMFSLRARLLEKKRNALSG